MRYTGYVDEDGLLEELFTAATMQDAGDKLGVYIHNNKKPSGAIPFCFVEDSATPPLSYYRFTFYHPGEGIVSLVGHQCSSVAEAKQAWFEYIKKCG